MRKTFSLLRKLHRDECGAEGLEKLLIIAAVVLPLLGILIWGKNAIFEWVTKKWNEIVETPDSDKGPFKVN
ncbi:MAG: hypothetical protein IMZ44_22410 [Planctomycetes bacterium]|nr:hypothetical protein [Planctomycetota bacterium]